MVAGVGESARWSRGPGLTVSDAEPDMPALVPVTRWAPATVVVHTLPVHEPSGPIVKVVDEVTSAIR